MAVTVELPVLPKHPKTATNGRATPTTAQDPGVEFPQRCVYCLAEVEGTQVVRLTYRRARDEAEARSVWQAPYCAGHLLTNRRITLFNKVAAGAAGVAGAAAAVKIAGSVQAVYLLQTLVFLLAAIPCILAGLLAWALLRSLLARFSRDIRHTGISGATIGFRIGYKKGADLVRFTFINADYARWFATINAGRSALPHAPTVETASAAIQPNKSR